MKILVLCVINSSRHRKCFVRNERVRVFDTNNSWIKPRTPHFLWRKLYIRGVLVTLSSAVSRCGWQSRLVVLSCSQSWLAVADRKMYLLFTGLPYGNPSRKVGDIFSVFFFFFSVSVKVLPVTPLLSGIFVHRAFCSYFLRIERVVEMRRFLWWTQNDKLNRQWRRKSCNANGVLVDLGTKYTLMKLNNGKSFGYWTRQAVES